MRASFQQIAAVILMGLITGCQSKPQIGDLVIGPDHKVSNYYHKDPILPPELRRVAVMPMTGATGFQANQGREQLQQVFRSELDKSGRFEAVYLRPEEVKQWTGQESWKAEEVLPPQLFEKVKSETGADGILFVNLSNYQPYPPLIVGWEMRLVRLDTKEQIWAVDEVFDAGESAVANSARRFNKGRVPTNPVLADSRSVLLSPGLFARYSLQASLGTMPAR